MLEGASIVSFAVDRWTDVPRCRHHVMSRLARRNRVLFTSSPWYVRDALRRGPAGAPTLTRISDNLHTYTPPRWLPARGGSLQPWRASPGPLRMSSRRWPVCRSRARSSTSHRP